MSVPNQKKIIIERSSDNVRKDFLKVSNENLYLAMYNLKSTTFLLWLYFTDNANGYALDLYPIDFLNKSGLSRSTYDRAMDELEDKGYLIQSKKNEHLYLFKEYSESEKIKHIDKVLSVDGQQLEDIKEEYFNQNEEDDSQDEQ